ncbi:MAG: hypothetical protein ACOYNJ_06570 [Candidatus Nanopelagicales bacterium]
MTTPARTTLTTLLALAPDLVERDRVRRQALRVAAVRHEGLSPLREVAFAGEGLALTWEIPVESESLVMGEGALAALAPVAAGLALLHDAGLAHGGISQGSLHVHDGRGVLCGWQPGGTPEADVHDLVALLHACLPPSSVSADVAHLLIAGADPDPETRPSMAKVAAVLEHASAVHAPLISPPAHRRARIGEAPPPRPAESLAADVAPRRSVTATVRGRHAARRAPAGTPGARLAGVRMPWRWGIAIAGTALAGFLGLSAMGSAGSAQQMCPAPSSADGSGLRPQTTLTALLASITGAGQGAGPSVAR